MLGIATLLLGIASCTFSVQQADLAQKNREADQQRVLDQQQQTVLVTYLDRISSLLPDLLKTKETDLFKPTERDGVRATAQAQTLAALQLLDPKRKRILLLFLYQTKLINVVNTQDMPHIAQQEDAIVSPLFADLTNADLSEVNIYGIFLREVNLYEADLSKAHLYNSNLYRANLGRANLSGADLNGAYLEGTYLEGADLTNATIVGGDLYLADLSGTHLSGANLKDADLRSAAITQQQLDQVYSCGGASLPEGLICHHNQ